MNASSDHDLNDNRVSAVKPSHRENRLADSRGLSWAILVVGFAVWIALQGFLILMPLFTRAMPPEPKDVLPYIARTARFQECLRADCPALKDLTKQLSEGSSDPQVLLEQGLAASPLGSNQVGFSALLVALTYTGLDLMQAYRVVYLAAPLLFGFGFAYLLCATWGRTVAGLTMLLLAFKVFPDSGLDAVVPSNVCMGIATFLWARVLARNGAAPWAFVVATPILIAMHPIGIAYVLMAASMALRLRGYRLRTIVLLSAAAFIPLALFATLFPNHAYDLSSYFRVFDVRVLAFQGADSLARVFIDLTVLREGLFGSLPVFGALVVIGFAAISPANRDRITKALVVCSAFLAVSLFFPPRDPGDFFLRIWIPVIVIVFGSLGSAYRYACGRAYAFVRSAASGKDKDLLERQSVLGWWPVALLAVCLGYGVQMSADGLEQILQKAKYRKERLPLKVCPSQMEALKAVAKPDDTVLYTSMTVMPYYFIHGAMSFGAVYYHPILADQQTTKALLARPGLHYAVVYNPLMMPPFFEGRHERRWGIAGPAFRYVPGSDMSRRFGPVLHEDGIRMAEYKWLEIEPMTEHRPTKLHLLVRNENQPCVVRCVPLFDTLEPRYDLQLEQQLPTNAARSDLQEAEGRQTLEKRALHLSDSRPASVEFDLRNLPEAKRFRIIIGGWRPQVEITGIRFDDSRLHWPWEHKARVAVMHRTWEAGEMIFSFDPSLLLPTVLRKDSVQVMNDCGSSVLMRLDRTAGSAAEEIRKSDGPTR